jgi:TnpA family transposase
VVQERRPVEILLTPEQRAQFVRVPPDLSEREIARYYTFSTKDLQAIARHRRPENRLGFAVQLAVLRFPGRTLTELPEVPERVLAFVAEQVGVPAAAFAAYGRRENTRYEHLDELRRAFGFRPCDWPALRCLARDLLPLALESDRPLPLVEKALALLRADQIIAPGMTTVERLTWGVLQAAQRRVERWLTEPLTEAHRTRLDGLVRADPDLPGRTRLSWLREAPEVASARSLRKVLERLAYVRALALPAVDRRLHPNRLRQLARRGARYAAQPLAKFAPSRRHALLTAYLADLGADLVDQALDLFDRLLGDVLRKGEKKQERHFQIHVRALNTNLSVLATAGDAFLQAWRDGLEPFATVFGAVGGAATFAAAVESSKRLVRPLDLDARDLIETKYSQVRGALLALYAAVEVRAVRGADPALAALDYVLALAEHSRRVTARHQRVGGEPREAPLGHVTERWRRLVYKGRKHLNPAFYEAAAFEALRDGLRSGDLSVAGSRRYRDFDSYLLPKARWHELQAVGETRLAITGTAEAYLEHRRQRIAELLADLHRSLAADAGGDAPGVAGLTVDQDGELRLPFLESAVPAAAKQLQRRLERRLPLIPLADVLNEVDRSTGCFGHLTHLSSGEPLDGERKQHLLAAVMALGLNHGLGKLARSTPFSYRQLAWAADWHLRDETLSKAQAALDNFVLHHPLARHWGDGTRSSSDGMRVKVAVRAANAERNAHHFHYDRGVTIYTHTADIRLPFAQQVISTNDREALYVIDALCSHETDLQIREHYTDTHGYTTHVFALCSLLGFRFAPRIRDVLDQRLYTVGRSEADYGPLNTLLKGRANARLITANWDEVLRVAASIRHGTVSAALLMRKLAAYPRQNQIARALHDIGQLEKTVFILELLLDPRLRRRQQRGLNDGESVNSIARALFTGQRGEFRDRAFQDQVHRASCLHLLIAAIGAWTTPHLADAIAVTRAEGQAIPDEYLAHLSPLAWNHVNLLGEYAFDPSQARSLENRRPLRSGAGDDGEEDDPTG